MWVPVAVIGGFACKLLYVSLPLYLFGLTGSFIYKPVLGIVRHYDSDLYLSTVPVLRDLLHFTDATLGLPQSLNTVWSSVHYTSNDSMLCPFDLEMVCSFSCLNISVANLNCLQASCHSHRTIWWHCALQRWPSDFWIFIAYNAPYFYQDSSWYGLPFERCQFRAYYVLQLWVRNRRDGQTGRLTGAMHNVVSWL